MLLSLCGAVAGDNDVNTRAANVLDYNVADGYVIRGNYCVYLLHYLKNKLLWNRLFGLYRSNSARLAYNGRGHRSSWVGALVVCVGHATLTEIALNRLDLTVVGKSYLHLATSGAYYAG